MVECRYSKWDSTDPSLASAGFMLKTPTFSLPFGVVANGLYGVQLKIARGWCWPAFFQIKYNIDQFGCSEIT